MGNTYELPSLGARSDTVTVSGMSSGSFMSMNLHVTMSDTIKGAGLMFGGSYWTPGFFNDRVVFDNKDLATLTQESINKAEEYNSSGEISDPSNLRGDPVYILSGTQDWTVRSYL